MSGSGPTGTDPAASDDRQEPSFREAFGAAVRGSGFARVAPGEVPTAASLLSAVGGIRGLIEAIVPGLAFLILYTLTRDLTLAVLVPVGIGIAFVAARLIARSPVSPAIVGLVGVAVSAVLALITGRPEDNFLPGIWLNTAYLVVIVISLIARYPLIGLIVGVLAGEGLAWRQDAAKRRVLTIATLLWAGLFAVRLIVEVPLFLAQEAALLAGAKLVLGVPFYAAMLWITWLIIRSVYGRSAASAAPASTE